MFDVVEEQTYEFLMIKPEEDGFFGNLSNYSACLWSLRFNYTEQSQPNGFKS